MKTWLHKQMEIIEKHLGGTGKAALAAGVTAASWSKWKAGNSLPVAASVKIIERLYEEALVDLASKDKGASNSAAQKAAGRSVRELKRNVYLKMKTLQEAREIWKGRIDWLRTAEEQILAASSIGRVTSRPIVAMRSVPHYHGAAMDGYAVRARDTYSASDTAPIRLSIGETAHAVDTGDTLPEGTDSVIMIENVENISPSEIEIRAAAFPWQHVRKVGEDIVAGELLLPQNHVLSPADAGSLLAAGILTVYVFGKPKVFIQPTGDEIIPAEKALEAKPGDIIEFNGTILSGMVEECGGSPTLCDIAPDDHVSLKNALRSGIESADVVLMMAGSSAGSEDFTSSVIAELGEVLAHGVAMMPGKPVILGIVNGKPVVGIPGYSVSAIMAFEQFVKPLIYSLRGIQSPASPTISATLGRQLPSKLGLEEFVRVILGRIDGNVIAMPIQRGAGIITSLTRADGILQIPQEQEGFEEGAQVEVRLIRPKERLDYTLIMIGSHDNTIDLIANELKGRDSMLHLSSSNVGSLGGLMALRRGQAHFAGSHLLDTQTGQYNYSYVERYLKGIPVRIVQLAMREQGLIIAKGNPKRITGIEDLLRSDVVFINRQAGSGTRVLFDYSIQQTGLRTDQINGYDQEEFTHMGVAIGVLSGRADAGMAIYSSARALDLEFIPLASERYDLVIGESAWSDFKVRTTLEIIASDSFRRKVTSMGGYDVSNSGKIMRIWDGREWTREDTGDRICERFTEGGAQIGEEHLQFGDQTRRSVYN